MPIADTHAGRSYPPTAPFVVTAGKIAEFAAALGDSNPAYAGEQPIAPPTFAAVLVGSAWDVMFDDPELGLALRRVVHGDQRFDYGRPLRSGDEVTAQLTIDKVRVRGAVDIISCSIALATTAGESVGSASATFFHSHEVTA